MASDDEEWAGAEWTEQEETPQCLSCSSKLRFAWDSRSFAEVVKGQPPMAQRMATQWSHLMSVISSHERDFYCCLRMINFCKVDVLLKASTQSNKLRFFNTKMWHQTFYIIRERLRYFWVRRETLLTIPCECPATDFVPRAFCRALQNNRINLRPCGEDERQKIEQLEASVKKMRGPHCWELEVFMWLSYRARLGNDLALYMFDFV